MCVDSILTEYEDYLKRVLISENGKYTLEEMLRINEERGVLFNLRGICNAMYKCIGSFGWIRKSDGSYTNTFTKINARKSFLKDLTLIVTLVPEDLQIETGGEADLSNAVIDNNSKKMQGVVISYSDKLTDDFDVDKIEFYKTMWHELQHAYRTYSFLLREKDKNRKTDNGYTINTKHYLNALKYGENVGRWFNVRNFFYLSDRNEIDSFFQEMVPYIKEHNEIDFGNVNNCLDSIPGYNIVKILKFFSDNFNIVENDEELREELTRQCRKIFENDNLTISQCVYRTKKRAYNAASYSIKQFYKILYTTLNKLKRKGYYTETHIKKDFDVDKMLTEILNLSEEYKSIT